MLISYKRIVTKITKVLIIYLTKFKIRVEENLTLRTLEIILKNMRTHMNI